MMMLMTHDLENTIQTLWGPVRRGVEDTTEKPSETTFRSLPAKVLLDSRDGPKYSAALVPGSPGGFRFSRCKEIS